MAWIDPSVVAQGEVLTSAKWNQDVVANTIALRVPPMCRLTRSTNQEISNSTVTVVGYDTVDIDTDATMGTTGAGAKITINTAGVYQVGYTILWGNTSTVGYRQAWVTIGGSGRYAGSTVFPAGSPSGGWFLTGTDILSLSAADTLDVRCIQASGGDETIGAFAGTPIAFYAAQLGLVS